MILKGISFLEPDLRNAIKLTVFTDFSQYLSTYVRILTKKERYNNRKKSKKKLPFIFFQEKRVLFWFDGKKKAIGPLFFGQLVLFSTKSSSSSLKFSGSRPHHSPWHRASESW